jgi:hypothetical protein
MGDLKQRAIIAGFSQPFNDRSALAASGIKRACDLYTCRSKLGEAGG